MTVNLPECRLALITRLTWDTRGAITNIDDFCQENNCSVEHLVAEEVIYKIGRSNYKAIIMQMWVLN